MIAFFWGGNDKLYAMSAWNLSCGSLRDGQYQFDPFFSGDAEMADWARRFARIRPRVILGYASTIARFAAFLDSQGETIGGIKAHLRRRRNCIGRSAR